MLWTWTYRRHGSESLPLKSVRDNYEKTVLDLRAVSTTSVNGIKIVPLLEFLLQ